MTFFCDLDGTLLDITEKFHRLYTQILREHGHEPLCKSEYWTLRRSGVTTGAVLARTGAGALLPQYEERFLSQVEAREWLAVDAPIDGVPDVLRRLRGAGRVVLVTLRRDRAALEWQLSHTGLDSHFDLVLSGHDLQSDGWQKKVSLVRDALPGGDFASSWFIGDTETDMRAGKALGCRTAAVLTGMRDEHSLGLTEPDLILPGIVDVAASAGL
jgi:phosphoglycolate phosphatase